MKSSTAAGFTAFLISCYIWFAFSFFLFFPPLFFFNGVKWLQSDFFCASRSGSGKGDEACLPRVGWGIFAFLCLQLLDPFLDVWEDSAVVWTSDNLAWSFLAVCSVMAVSAWVQQFSNWQCLLYHWDSCLMERGCRLDADQYRCIFLQWLAPYLGNASRRGDFAGGNVWVLRKWTGHAFLRLVSHWPRQSELCLTAWQLIGPSFPFPKLISPSLSASIRLLCLRSY